MGLIGRNFVFFLSVTAVRLSVVSEVIVRL